MNIEEFEKVCKEKWGDSLKDKSKMSDESVPRIQDFVDFDNINNNLKIHIADKLIRNHTENIGSIFDDGDVIWYIRNFGEDIVWKKGLFDHRRLVAIKSATLLMAANLMKVPSDYSRRNLIDHIIAGGQPLAAVYLLSQLEYLFRVKNRYLNEEGIITRKVPSQLARKLNRSTNVNDRISNIQDTFLMYLYRNSTPLGERLRKLNDDLDIHNRLRLRHGAMHGPMGDISVEGYLYGLLIAMFYYNED